MVQLGKERGVAKPMDAAMTNSLKLYSLNFPGLTKTSTYISNTNKKLTNYMNKMICLGIINVLIYL